MQTTFRTFASVADFEAFLARKERAFIFKHSTRCGTSAGADQEFEEFAEEVESAGAGGPGKAPVPIYRVLVIENRPVSDAIVRLLGIRHQSPQAILVENGTAVWTASHGAITAGALRKAWESEVGSGRKSSPARGSG
jgi:monothiol bacilliredoxin